MASDTTTALAGFIRYSMSKPFSYHSNNCGMWISDWVKRRRNVDPAVSVRGYSPMAFHRLLDNYGGVETLARALASEAHLEVTNEPQTGDIGLVQSPLGPMLAIKTQNSWVAKSSLGVVGASYPMIVAWKV